MLFNSSFTQFVCKTALVLSLCFWLKATTAQPVAKTQIVLIGIFHLTPSQQDIYQNKKIDLHTAARQTEIQQVVARLVAFKPDQVCLEYPIEEQPVMDSTYQAYKAGKYVLKDNERDLFGFQAVDKLGLPSPTCINYSPHRFDADTVVKFAATHGQQSILADLQKESVSFQQKIDSVLPTRPLREMLLYSNTPASLEKNLSLYTQYLARIGKDSNYAGADLVADWYSTNIHIYSNILRVVKPGDKRIVVIFGQGHVPILKHLLSNNPDFEVVEAATILK